MASCTHIERSIQAYVDGEIGPSDKIVIEQHVHDCPDCERLLRRQQRACACLFEVLGEDRLRHSLVLPVLEHLPELETEHKAEEVYEVNWRLKHPVGRLQRMLSFVPLAAGILLVLLAGALMSQWPDRPGIVQDPVGVVTHCTGQVNVTIQNQETREMVAVRDYVGRGERYETAPGASLMLSVMGPTNIKVREGTRVKVFDERRISVETGEVWVDVGRDGRLFRVITPFGDVTVFGTCFAVQVRQSMTVVTVEEGRVQVENEVAFRELTPGQQVEVVSGKPLLLRNADIEAVMGWARVIQPDYAALSMFIREIQSKSPGQLAAEQMWVITDLEGRTVMSVCLEWAADEFTEGHSGYQVYVSDDRMTPLYKGYVASMAFSEKSKTMMEIVPPKPIRDVSVLHIKIVPDFGGGQVQTSFTRVYAHTR